MELRVPRDWEKARSYSPAPDSLLEAASLNKFVLINLENQYLAGYEKGKQVLADQGTGTLEFPDEASQDQISDAINRTYAPTPTPAPRFQVPEEPEPVPPKPESAIATGLRAALTGAFPAAGTFVGGALAGRPRPPSIGTSGHRRIDYLARFDPIICSNHVTYSWVIVF